MRPQGRRNARTRCRQARGFSLLELLLALLLFSSALAGLLASQYTAVRALGDAVQRGRAVLLLAEYLRREGVLPPSAAAADRVRWQRLLAGARSDGAGPLREPALCVSAGAGSREVVMSWLTLTDLPGREPPEGCAVEAGSRGRSWLAMGTYFSGGATP